MGIIVTIVTGLIIGIVAKLLMPGRDPGGIIVTILLGIAGSFVGTWLADIAGLELASGWGAFIAGIVGAIILLLVYRLVVGRRA